ncbi:MAG: VOC family protein [Actinomycetota bacterium]
MADFPGVAHVALTVSDLSVSALWYERLFGLAPVLDEDAGTFYHKGYLVPGGVLIGLHQHHHTATDGPFNEFKTGLDHLSFVCKDLDELKSWASRLDELGIAHSEIEEHSYGTDVSFRDPDNIALEFFVPA